MGGEPAIRLVAQTEGEFLGNGAVLARLAENGRSELRLPAGSIPIGPHDVVHFDGEHVAILDASPGGGSVRILDARGRSLWERDLRAAHGAVVFDDAIALPALNLHEPGGPYSLEFLRAGHTTSVSRPDRRILDLSPLEHHLVVTSRAIGTRADITAEVYDRHGTVSWGFSAPFPCIPRVAVDGARVGLVYPGRNRSAVDLLRPGRPDPSRLELEETLLTELVLSSDGSGALAWGPRDVVWIDTEPPAVRWRARLPGGVRPLAADRSTFTPIAETAAVPVRGEMPDNAWRVDLLMLDLSDGSITARRHLFDSTRRPTRVSRFRYGDAERLVFRGSIFDLAADGEEPR